MNKKKKKGIIVLLILYFCAYLGYLILKNPIGIAYGQSSYFSKIICATNLVPFYFDPNVPYKTLSMNAVIKMIMLIPAVYFYSILTNKNNLSEMLSFVIILGLCIESLQVLTLKGYFDVTDIIYYIMGSCLFYVLYSSIKKIYDNR